MCLVHVVVCVCINVKIDWIEWRGDAMLWYALNVIIVSRSRHNRVNHLWEAAENRHRKMSVTCHELRHVTHHTTSHKMPQVLIPNELWQNDKSKILEQARWPFLCNSRVPRYWLIQFKSVTMSIYLMSASSLWLCKYSQTGFWSKIMSKFVCSRPLTWNEWCLMPHYWVSRNDWILPPFSLRIKQWVFCPDPVKCWYLDLRPPLSTPSSNCDSYIDVDNFQA